jgi:hypothetical protein
MKTGVSKAKFAEGAKKIGCEVRAIIAVYKAYSFYQIKAKKKITVTKFPYQLNGQTIGVAGVEYEIFK